MLRPVLLWAACGLLAACQTGPTASSGRRLFQAGLGDAVQAPLEDFNLKQSDIPNVLLAARAAPYAVSGLDDCAALSATIVQLDEALGPDIDHPASSIVAPLDARAAEAALDVVRGAATDVIPFRSWVRRLSGAAQHSRAVQSAIGAGLARRAFLKGVGHQRACAPPSAPYPPDPRP